MLAFEKSIYTWKQPKKYHKSSFRLVIQQLGQSVAYFWFSFGVAAFHLLRWYHARYILEKPGAPSLGVALLLVMFMMLLLLYGIPYLYYFLACCFELKAHLKPKGIYIDGFQHPTVILYDKLEAYGFTQVAGHRLIKLKEKDGAVHHVPLPDAETQGEITRHLTELYGPPRLDVPAQESNSAVG